jgi:hypothetical protein
VDYTRNTYHNEFINSLSHFSHGPNHHSYGFGSFESGFVPRHFGFDPRSHHGARPPCRHDSSTRGAYSHFEPSRFDGPRFSRHGSHPTLSNGEVQRIVKTSSGRMIKYWIPKIFLTNPNTEPLIFSHSM